MSELQIKLETYAVDFLGSAWLRHSVSVLLVVLSGLLMWTLVPSKSKSIPVAANTTTVSPRMSIGASAEKIATTHLFGQSPDANADAGPAVTAATITIQGLFYSDDKDMAWAILDVNGKSDIFKTGDTLPDGEKLVAVGVDAIQIANGPGMRVVEMAQTFGPASGIELGGVPNLYARQDSFPGQTPLSTAAPVVPRMRTVSLPQGNDPIAQMRALREQLIQH